VRALGAEVVVGVDVNHEGAKFLAAPNSFVGVLLQSIILMQRTALAHQRQLADVVVSPRVGHIRWDEMTRSDELIAAGEEAARAALKTIRELLEPQPAETSSNWLSLRRQLRKGDGR
jgi:NTE family protein